MTKEFQKPWVNLQTKIYSGHRKYPRPIIFGGVLFTVYIIIHCWYYYSLLILLFTINILHLTPMSVCNDDDHGLVTYDWRLLYSNVLNVISITFIFYQNYVLMIVILLCHIIDDCHIIMSYQRWLSYYYVIS